MGFLVLTILLLFTRQGQSGWVHGYGPVTYEKSDGVCTGQLDMITSAEECEKAADALGITFNPCCQSIDNEPYGCTFRVPDNDILFNGKISMETILMRGEKDNRIEVCSKPMDDCDDGYDWCKALSPDDCIYYNLIGWAAPAECCVCEIFYPNRRELNEEKRGLNDGRRELQNYYDEMIKDKKGGKRGFNGQGRRELQNYYDEMIKDKKGGKRGFNNQGRRELQNYYDEMIKDKKGGKRGFNNQGRRELQNYYKPGSCYIDCDQVEDGYASDFFCGKKSQDGCWCDEACYYYQDCCEDVAEHCDYHPPSRRALTNPTKRFPRLLTQFDL